MQSRDSHNKRDQNHSNYKSTDQVNVIKDSFVNTTGRFDLQLNPWNNLEQQSVANAIVLASSALPSLYPIVNAIMTMVQIDNPSSPILIKKSFVKMDSFIGRGFSFITFFECGSNPRAIAGRLSVKRLINSRCTGAKGTGSAISEA